MNLSNKYIFWFLISVLLALFVAFMSSNSPQQVVQNQPDTADRSFQPNKEYVVDLEKIDEISDIEDMTSDNNIDKTALNTTIKKVSSSNNFLIIVYTVLLSILFIYREKQNRKTITLLEKRDDELKILEANQHSTTIYTNLSDELKPYAQFIQDDIKLDTLEEKIEHEPKYLILASRIILEKLITSYYIKYSKEENNLNGMIIFLYKKRILNHNMHNFSHIIKAFGNNVAHPNIKNPQIFNSKDATLVLGSLLQFLKELESNNMLQELKYV